MATEEQTPLERAMARFAGGEDAALGEVYDLASPRVFTFLLRLCGERTLAEDLTQETFLRIHRARGLYRVGAAVMPWAYTIARRLFLDAMRARRAEVATSTSTPTLTLTPNNDGSNATGSGSKHVEDPTDVDRGVRAPGPSAEQLLADAELARAVDEALAKIPETQASAFRLLKGEGLSVAEVALVMGTTKGAVKLRAHRAYQTLRTLLGEHLSVAGRRAPVVSASTAAAPKWRERT